MTRTYFEEIQKFRDSAWIWVLVVSISAAIILPLAETVNKQLVNGSASGNNAGVIGLICFMTIAWVALVFILFSIKLEVKIDDGGIHYRYFPLFPSWQTVTRENIIEYKLEKRFRFFDTGGIGYHRNRLRNSKSFRISGSKHLFLRLKDGLRLRLGTQNLQGVEWAMTRLMKIE